MTYFEMGFLGLTFLLTMLNSFHLLSKERIAMIEKEVLAAKAKLVLDAQEVAKALESRVAFLESKLTSSEVSPTSSGTSLPAPPTESASSPPVV